MSDYKGGKGQPRSGPYVTGAERKCTTNFKRDDLIYLESLNRQRERERVNETEHWLDRRYPNDTMMMMMMMNLCTCCSVRGRTAK